jgi:uroporphyrinogen decarboxylase
LAPAQYREFSLHYMSKIVDGLTREAHGRVVPRILFTKGGGPWLSEMAKTNCDALGIDWTTDLANARRTVADSKALQGNLDPSILYAPPNTIREHVARVLASYGRGHGHVFNLGHGIHPDVPPEHAAAMIAAVHELSPQYHL